MKSRNFPPTDVAAQREWNCGKFKCHWELFQFNRCNWISPQMFDLSLIQLLQRTCIDLRIYNLHRLEIIVQTLCKWHICVWGNNEKLMRCILHLALIKNLTVQWPFMFMNKANWNARNFNQCRRSKQLNFPFSNIEQIFFSSTRQMFLESENLC